MINKSSQLILLEGLPGTGKSTNSRIIMSNIEQSGQKVKWTHEVARPHPTLFFNEANLTQKEFDTFINQFPEHKEIINSLKIELDSTISFDLLEIEWNYMDRLDDVILKVLKQYDVWDFPLEKYINVALEKWKCFVEDVKKDDDLVVILDSSLFQFQIYTFLGKNVSYPVIESFINQLFETISELDPSIIYLYRKDVEDTISYIEKTRGKEFSEQIWNRDKHLPYYQNRPTGADGYRSFLRDYHLTVEKLFEVTPFKKLRVEISDGNWNLYVSEMLSFLEIEKRSYDQPVTFPIGIYINEQLGLNLEVHEGYIIDPSGNKKHLIPRNENEFYVEDLPIILRFEKPDKVVVIGEQLIDRWTANRTIFVRRII
ncbi:hypothetical protein [Fictibacillus sp. BK138]|uniref:hypothetical protein n=1 Tax=Fictibacillus sp. BK138 TaxID=2512121 RepID=UPI001029E623|nr:hypothetical protein [Fictibacillus sp. BK138]RZT15586.1 hypothetical protein EV282_3792 [Fictibacillus sp. BK138]